MSLALHLCRAIRVPRLRRSILQFKSKHPLYAARSRWGNRTARIFRGEKDVSGRASDNRHVSSPRIRHVCISWDTVMKLPLELAIRGRVSARPCSPLSPVSPSDPSLPRENPFSPSRPLPWERRTGRTWSTRAKLSAKLRKIVSDTSSDPPPISSIPLTLPPPPCRVVPPPGRQQWYRQADRRASRVKGGRTSREWTKGGWIYDKRARAHAVSCPFVTDIWPTRGPCTPPEIQHVRDRYARDIYRHECCFLRARTHDSVCIRLGLEAFSDTITTHVVCL